MPRTEAETVAAERFEALVAARGAGDRYPIFAALRETTPVFFSPSLDLWVVTRYEDVLRVLRDEESFTNLSSGRGAPLHGRILLNMTGQEHRLKVRPLAKRLRDPSTLQNELDDLVAAIVHPAVAALPDSPTVVDLRTDFTSIFPLEVITSLLALGEATAFRGWYDDINRAGLESVAQPDARERGEKAIRELQTFLSPIIAERRRNPGRDLLSELCALTFEDEPLSEREVVGYTSFLLVAGTETTDRALCNLLVELADDPEQWGLLRSDRSLVPSACAEILRCVPPVQGLQREVAAETEVAGAEVKPGDRVLALLSSANRDAEMFDDPERFDVTRFRDDAERQFIAAGRILPFGAGRHYCTGSMLAKLEMVMAVNALLDRFVAVEPEGGHRPEHTGLIMHSPEHFRAILHPA